jgi:tetratricopeptide (TPR) repeat protein
MKKIIIFLLLAACVGLFSDSINEVISQAKELANSGELDEAAETLEKTNLENPNNPDILVELGNVYSKQAGSTSNFLKAGKLSGQAFSTLDKALEIDPAHINGHLYRGILGASVPAFMGKLQQAEADFMFIQKYVKPMPNELNVTVLFYLGMVYEKQDKFVEALETFKAVECDAGDSYFGKNSAKRISKLEKKAEKQLKKQTKKQARSLDDGNKLMGKGNLDEAAEIYRELIKSNPDDLQASLMLANCLGTIAESGYDSKINENTEYMSNLAFEVMATFENIVRLDADNIEMRFAKNELAIGLPFFVGKLDSAIEDLEWIKLNKPDHQARALFLLGKAYKKLANSYWAKAVNEYDEETKQQILKAMKPTIQYINEEELSKPCVAIDIVLGFQDELAPQLAIWIEDDKGNFIKTVYVSGFAGYVKGKQTTLPKWAESSEFKDADVVTGASVDIGHHLFVWQLDDIDGKLLEKGAYKVHLEICHWPHVIYEHSEIPITIGSKKQIIKNNENEMIPQIRLTYFPKK